MKLRKKTDPQRPKRQSMSIEEATISNMWEIAANYASKSTEQTGVSEEEG